MASVNTVILVGNLGADPETRSLNNGSKVCNLSVATTETWKDKQSGEKREKTEWHRVVCFDEHKVRYAENYLRKGAKVYIEGSLQTRKWQDRDGNDKYTTEIVIQKFRGELIGLDKPPQQDNRGDFEPNRVETPTHDNDFDLDDDIPF